MPQPASIGYATMLGVGASAPTTKEIEFISCDLAARAQQVQSDGIRGLRGRQAESVVDGVTEVSGLLVLEPRADELAALLPFILGGTPAGNSYPLADALPPFVVDLAKVADVYRCAGCKVNRATFQSSRNRPLQLSLEIQALTETGGVTFPAISGSLSTQPPFIHHQAALTLSGAAYACDNISVVIDNGLITDRYLNSRTRVSLPEADRVVTLAADFPFTTDLSSLYNLAVAGLPGAVSWTSGALQLAFTFAALQAPTIGPAIEAKGRELVRRISFQARRLGATAELITTCAATP